MVKYSDVGWMPTKPTRSKENNCAVVSPIWNGVTDWVCQTPETHPFTCACSIPESHYDPKFATSVFVLLRGLCKHSNFDSYFYPWNWENGDFGYAGLTKSIILYNGTMNFWVITTGGGVETVAVSTASYDGFVLGAHDWVIENEDKRCNEVRENLM